MTARPTPIRAAIQVPPVHKVSVLPLLRFLCVLWVLIAVFLCMVFVPGFNSSETGSVFLFTKSPIEFDSQLL